MTREELTKAAIEYLGKVLQNPGDFPTHLVQAAVSIVLAPEEPRS